MSSISVVIDDHTSKSEKDAQLSHLLSGSVAQNVIEMVLKMPSNIEGFSSQGQCRRRLRELWYKNLDTIGGVPLSKMTMLQNREVIQPSDNFISHPRLTEVYLTSYSCHQLG